MISVSIVLCGPALADDARSWDLTLGAGVASMPQYSGAATSHPRLRLWADAEYRTHDLGTIALDSGSLTIDPELRWNVVDRPDAGFGPLLGYRFGRGDTDPGLTSGNDGNSHLQGLPEVGSAADAGVQGHVPVLGVPFFAQLRTALSGSQGTLFNLGLYLPLQTGSWTFTFLPTVTWADARQMRALYGVSPQASAASGFASYSPGAGWENAALELAGEWHLSRSAHLVASFAYERLVGGAAASPVVERRNQLSVLGGATWSF
jgi:outer membrane scaffolding protein for murein synthesis (MipA/OmpV family)